MITSDLPRGDPRPLVIRASGVGLHHIGSPKERKSSWSRKNSFEEARSPHVGGTHSFGSSAAFALSDDDSSYDSESVYSAPTAVGVGQSNLGTFLTGPEGRTLYIFTKDAPNVSNCTAECLAVWPPLLASDEQSVAADASTVGAFGTINTPSGTQVTYNSAPLYYYAGDAKAGDTNGNLIAGVWFVARPETASTAIVGVRDAGDADYLVGPNGMALYFFANDEDGVSKCSGSCIANWPALKVPEGLEPTAVADAAGTLGALTRSDDGSRQVTYNSRPLYFFPGRPGDTRRRCGRSLVAGKP
jgi:predicted lipoprotein with Yx(FWY)xxD motif